MKQWHTAAKNRFLTRKTVTPMKGVTVFFYSTGKGQLQSKAVVFAISPHSPTFSGRRSLFLPKKHHFRRHLAKHPLPLVVMTEGQKKPLEKLWEVAA